MAEKGNRPMEALGGGNGCIIASIKHGCTYVVSRVNESRFACSVDTRVNDERSRLVTPTLGLTSHSPGDHQPLPRTYNPEARTLPVPMNEMVE
jgi:hypothetical protein